MFVLGIETSCDETSAAVVRDGKVICSCKTVSSLKFHKKYKGIVPEIASRMQLETISQVADSAIKDSSVGYKDIGLIGVTDRPGLLGSLLVGVSFAKALSFSLGKPLLGVNHLHSHIFSAFLGKKIKFPFVALIVSGGHTSLFYVRDFSKIEPLGQTQDDACGEAFDKVAKILSLGYPGGPHIERMARKGNVKKYKFSCSNTIQPLNFSFSGIKTAVMYTARNKSLSFKEKQDICASFQESVIKVLIKKSFLACSIKKTNDLIIGGGVAANKRLREEFYSEAKVQRISVNFAPLAYCIDNAAMVAGLGYWLYKNGSRSGLNLSARPD